jgi:hypothetical protein
MPSVIGADSGSGVNVAANYLKTRPSTRFGTRQLSFYDVQITGVATNFLDPNSDYSKAVRAIQTQAEIYAVGEPSSDHFIVVVAADTTNDGSNTDGGANEMAQTLSTATGGTVTAKHLHGAGFAGGLLAYSDESQAAGHAGDI